MIRKSWANITSILYSHSHQPPIHYFLHFTTKIQLKLLLCYQLFHPQVNSYRNQCTFPEQKNYHEHVQNSTFRLLSITIAMFKRNESTTPLLFPSGKWDKKIFETRRRTKINIVEHTHSHFLEQSWENKEFCIYFRKKFFCPRFANSWFYLCKCFKQYIRQSIQNSLI